MSFGGVQGMITALKNNRLMKGERKTMYDRKNDSVKGVYGPTDDHTKMKSHEFAIFQKEQFANRRKERKRSRKLKLMAFLVTLLIVLLFLMLWYYADFKSWTSSFFQ